MTSKKTSEQALRSRIADEMADSLDEELEMEIDDHRLDQYQVERSDHPKPNAIDRRVYFAELLHPTPKPAHLPGRSITRTR